MPCTLPKSLQRFVSAAVVRSSLFATALLAVATPAPATTFTFTEAGFSKDGTPLLVSARIDTAADAGGPNNALKITLSSSGAPTKHASDVLTSFYFNIADPNTGIRPTLTYVSGTGQAYEVRSTGTDAAVSWAPDLSAGGSSGTWTTSGGGTSAASILVAENDFNEGWQFKTLSPPPAYPGLGFGIGTVGNSDLWQLIPGGTPGNPEGFDGKVIRGTDPSSALNLGIYSVGEGTDIDPVGAADFTRLVRTEAVFRFTSDRDLDSLTQTWVQGNVVFGFGTGPDTVLLPEPGGLALAATGGVLALGCCVRRRRAGAVAPGRQR